MRNKWPAPFIRFWLGNAFFVYTDNPKIAEIVLNSPHCLDKGQSYRFLDYILGGGLITLPGLYIV